MPLDQTEWLSLAEASEFLGVHPTSLRRWTDAGSIPCLRTPGGHRRFRSADLAAWMQGRQTSSLVPQSEVVVRNAVGFTRQEMTEMKVSNEPWYLAFAQGGEIEEMRDAGRRLFGLAIQCISRTSNHEPFVQEGRHIAEYYGLQCARRGVSLVDTVRALFFFRESLLRAAKPGQAIAGQYDAEDVRIHRQLRHFLDEIMYACLASYETTCRTLLQAGCAP